MTPPPSNRGELCTEDKIYHPWGGGIQSTDHTEGPATYLWSGPRQIRSPTHRHHNPALPLHFLLPQQTTTPGMLRASSLQLLAPPTPQAPVRHLLVMGGSAGCGWLFTILPLGNYISQNAPRPKPATPSIVRWHYTLSTGYSLPLLARDGSAGYVWFLLFILYYFSYIIIIKMNHQHRNNNSLIFLLH